MSETEKLYVAIAAGLREIGLTAMQWWETVSEHESYGPHVEIVHGGHRYRLYLYCNDRGRILSDHDSYRMLETPLLSDPLYFEKVKELITGPPERFTLGRLSATVTHAKL